MNNIIDNATFVRDQRENVIAAIRRIQSDFHPVYTPPQLHYSNKLLTAHNTGIQPIGKTPYEMVWPSQHRQFEFIVKNFQIIFFR